MALRNIDDLLKLHYSPAGEKYLQKSDAPVLSTTTGVYNAVYGANAWRQLNTEANAFGLLQKVAFNRSGWRVVTARGNVITTPTGGIEECGALPETKKPTFAELSAKPKEVVHTFDVSTKQEFLAKVSNDDAIGDLEYLKQYWAVEHAEHINAMLLQDLDTLAGNNMESIDRVVASNSEITGGHGGAGDADIYSQDRDAAASWVDAYVNHNSGTDRAVTDPLIRTTLANQAVNGGKASFILTGHDQAANLAGLYGDQARYMNPMGAGKVKVGINGVETSEGSEVGLNVSTLYGIPVMKDARVAKDTSSRIYFLDASNPEGFEYSRLHIAVAQPTSYYETRDIFVTDKLASEGAYYTSAELRCTFFAAQAKLMDLL